METTDLLARMRAGADGLARAAVDELLDARLSDLIRPEAAARALAALLSAQLRSPQAAKRAESLLDRILRGLEKDPAPLHERIPEEVQKALRGIAGRSHAVDREVVLAVLDQEPLRALVREILRDAVVGFATKVSAPVTENPLAKGLGSLGRFAREQAVARTGALGALAGGMASAVSAEVEKQVEKRASEYVDQALSGVIERLASQVTDPARAREAAALRLALLEGMLDIYTDELAREIRRASPGDAAAHLRSALAGWLARPEGTKALARAIQVLIEPEKHRPLRATLEDLGLLETFEKAARELALVRTRALLESDAFARWLGSI